MLALTSQIFKENIAKWSNRGLTLLYLPPYSPELNIIEILWRFIKYHWIEMSAFQSYTNMRDYVQKILREYGTKRVIDFSLFEKKFYPLVTHLTQSQPPIRQIAVEPLIQASLLEAL